MDGILVQDSDWSRKLSLSLYDLLKKKLLCDLGIVCSAQNDVTNIKSNEVVMVHRCVLSAASETIKHLSVGGQVYNLVKINGVNISIQCWDKVLEFVYCGNTAVQGSQLCDIRRAAQVLQIKALERAVDVHHVGYPLCLCPNKDPSVNSMSLSTSTKFCISSEKWVSELFEAMLDLLVKQTLCNMTIITEKCDKTSAEILAHLCMLVAASSTIRELVLQGSDTYNSVKIDSIAYNTWLYLLEYIYTSRVSIVKSNIPEVWVASQLLQIDGLANAVSPFANQISVSRGLGGLVSPAALKIMSSTQEKSSDSLSADVNSQKSNGHNQQSLSDKTLCANQDLMDIKSRSSSGSCDTESPSAAVNDENSLGLSLNSDSCDAQSTSNPLDKLDIASNEPLNGDQNVCEPTIDGNSVLGHIEGNIKSEQSAEISSLISADSGTDLTQASTLSNSLLSGAIPSGSSILHNAQLIPVQTATAGVVQATPQIVSGMGQWLQTMGLDGATPTMLWLPQGMIPVVATSQASTQSLTSNTTVKAPTSPLKSANPAKADTSADIRKPKESTSTAGSNTKTSEKNYLYFCRKCERVFSQSSYLDKHKCTGVLQSEAVSSTRGIRSGTTTNKLQCKFCMKIFSRTWTLNVHMRTHTGERPYKCMICNKAFSDKSNMRQHTLIHTENKQFKCPNCQQAFAQKRYMKKHYVETCRRKVIDPDASVAKDKQTVVEFDETLLSNSKSPPEMPQQNMVIYVPKPANPSGSKIIKAEVLDTAATNSHAKWDTSIIMSGDDVTMSRDEDTDSEPAQFESQEPEDPLTCGFCKRHFKNERQRNSHRCRYA